MTNSTQKCLNLKGVLGSRWFIYVHKRCTFFLEKSVKCTRRKKVQIYENKTRKRESVVTRFQVKLEEIQICELLGLISHTNMFGMPFFKHTKPTPCI